MVEITWIYLLASLLLMIVGVCLLIRRKLKPAKMIDGLLMLTGFLFLMILNTGMDVSRTYIDNDAHDLYASLSVLDIVMINVFLLFILFLLIALINRVFFKSGNKRAA